MFHALCSLALWWSTDVHGGRRPIFCLNNSEIIQPKRFTYRRGSFLFPQGPVKLQMVFGCVTSGEYVQWCRRHFSKVDIHHVSLSLANSPIYSGGLTGSSSTVSDSVMTLTDRPQLANVLGAPLPIWFHKPCRCCWPWALLASFGDSNRPVNYSSFKVVSEQQSTRSKTLLVFLDSNTSASTVINRNDPIRFLIS